MREIRFHQWEEVLQHSSLPESQKQSWTITIRWFLSFCRRGRAGITAQSARDFIEWAQREKQPEAWKVERWKEAIRWFFKSAPRPAAGSHIGAPASSPSAAKILRREGIGEEWKPAKGDQVHSRFEPKAAGLEAPLQRQAGRPDPRHAPWKEERDCRDSRGGGFVGLPRAGGLVARQDGQGCPCHPTDWLHTTRRAAAAAGAAGRTVGGASGFWGGIAHCASGTARR
jgi:hypothetical protein